MYERKEGSTVEKLAIEYGDGLYALAREEGLTNELREEAKTLRSVFLENPSYISLLTSRKLSSSERAELMKNCFAGRVHPYLYSFLLLLADRGYLPYATSCLSRYEECWLADHNIYKVTVTSAAELSEEQKERVKKSLDKKTGRNCEIDWKTDGSLMAGLRVQADGLLIENSAKQRFEELKRALGASVT